MGKVGRPRKYATPEEAAEANRKKQNERDKENSEKINSDPVLKAEKIKNQVKANNRYLAKLPVEIKRKKWRVSKSKWRAKKKKIANIFLSKIISVSQFNTLQLKVACEQAQEN